MAMVADPPPTSLSISTLLADMWAWRRLRLTLVGSDNERSVEKLPVVNVLFVCMGNICRSPLAEGVFRMLVERKGLSRRISIDSAGTHDYQRGELADIRAVRAARARGYDLSRRKARRSRVEDFD